MIPTGMMEKRMSRNRYIVECKVNMGRKPGTTVGVEIDTLWNVKLEFTQRVAGVFGRNRYIVDQRKFYKHT